MEQVLKVRQEKTQGKRTEFLVSFLLGEKKEANDD